MITIEIPSAEDFEKKICQYPPGVQAEVRVSLLNQRSLMQHLATVPSIDHLGQALDALIGTYGSMAGSCGFAELMQECATQTMRLSMHLARLANAQRQQEAQAATVYGPNGMPPSPHTH